ncbi:MAG: hypothetical protein JJE03_00325 [Peptostreptococcaceae bacterium]|nr:hypothetical protein [Peptostreptococcaceae bacterium]
MKTPEKVMDLLKEEGAVKIITTISKEGKLHSVVAGSIMALDEKSMFVAEIFMNTTSENLQSNNKAAFLIAKGAESYLINATAKERHIEGAFYDTMSGPMKAKGLPVKAVWTFDIDEIFDQSASPNAGKKLA